MNRYDAEISLSEVIELSLNQVESMAQGRKIAIAQEESINLRKMIEKRIPESETKADFDIKIVHFKLTYSRVMLVKPTLIWILIMYLLN